jgi:hypothetical protein
MCVSRRLARNSNPVIDPKKKTREDCEKSVHRIRRRKTGR